MAGSFVTEKQVEQWLQLETRSISMPGGWLRPVSGFRLMWEGWDRLTGSFIWSAEEITRVAWDLWCDKGGDFNEAFTATVTQLINDYRDGRDDEYIHLRSQEIKQRLAKHSGQAFRAFNKAARPDS